MNETPAAPPAPSAPRKAPRQRLWLAAGAGAVAIGAGVWFMSIKLPKWLGAPAAPAATEAAPAGSDTRKIHATLFYVSDDGTQLVPVSQEVVYGATPGEQARRIADAQLQAPPKGLLPAIPAGTTVRGLYLTSQGAAYIDLSREIISGHTGGSLDEALTVYAIVNALTVNLPDVSGVQILIDGKQVDTIAGHIDLRRPLKRSLKWVRKGQ